MNETYRAIPNTQVAVFNAYFVTYWLLQKKRLAVR